MINKIKTAVEKNKQLILSAYEYIWKNPETGYKEVKTSKYLEDAFEKLGYELVRAGNVPGFYTVLDTGRKGPEILILGELDSLICFDHPECDKQTGAVHSCGHCAQAAALLGIAAALKEPGVLDEMCGRVRLCAVPAEELIEVGFRNDLKKKGIIRYLGGKVEFLYRGYFDGVDAAFMVHTTPGDFSARKGSVGFCIKEVSYKGVSSHAGGNPAGGKNALYAANAGLASVNAIRETFLEKDQIRVHPIITKGGDAVNAIPDLVKIESYVRANNFDAIKETNAKMNKALIGGALSLGTNIEIDDQHGYSPLINDDNMITLAKDAAELMFPEREFKADYNTIGTGSTDMGDISLLFPTVHPYMPGAKGNSHSNHYIIENPEMATVDSAKWQVTMLYLLLKDGGKRAEEIKKEFKPMFASKDEFIKYIDTFERSGERIEYNADGTAKVILG